MSNCPSLPACSPLEAAFAETETPLDQWIRRRAEQPPAVGRQPVVVCRVEELPPGAKCILEHRGISVGVFNLEGEFFAIKNVCPHYGAPLCRGSVHGTHRPSPVASYEPVLAGRVIRCPWHGWEFDIVTGKALYDRKSRVATYKVEINSLGEIVLWI